MRYSRVWMRYIDSVNEIKPSVDEILTSVDEI
jgi:hypothetical protein